MSISQPIQQLSLHLSAMHLKVLQYEGITNFIQSPAFLCDILSYFRFVLKHLRDIYNLKFIFFVEKSENLIDKIKSLLYNIKL